MMMKRERVQKTESCCPSVKLAKAQNIFAPRPFAPPVEEREAPMGGSCLDFSLADISILPRGTVQPKLLLGPVGDKYEQEADRVARQVVDTISSSDQGAVQRQEDLEDEEEPEFEEEEELLRKVDGSAPSGGADVGPDLESAIQRARSGGQPLSEGVCQPMERAFGADFGGVRVHADGEADRLNRSLQARAFTTGRDIFLRQGEYRPGSSEGQRLLAHELTHVVQQKLGLVKPTIWVGNMPVNDVPNLEAEENQMGRRATRFQLPSPLKPVVPASPQGKQRQRKATEAHHSYVQGGRSVGSGVVQRDVFVYTPASAIAYHGADLIQYSRYVRTGNAGGNHFIAHSNIVTTVQDLIANRTRNQSLTILTPLIQTPNLLPAQIHFNNDVDHDYWLDYVINDISLDARNIWAGVSNNAPNSTLADMSPQPAERAQERLYHNWLRNQLINAYAAAGKGIPIPVANFMNYADNLLNMAGYP